MPANVIVVEIEEPMLELGTRALKSQLCQPPAAVSASSMRASAGTFHDRSLVH